MDKETEEVVMMVLEELESAGELIDDFDEIYFDSLIEKSKPNVYVN